MLETIKAIVIALLVSAAVWKAASDHYGKIIATMEAGRADAVAKEQANQLAEKAAKDKIIHDAGEQHAKDQLLINALSSKPNSVRLHLAGGGAMPKAGASTGNSSGTCGVASTRIDEYLAEAQQAINDIGQRCAQLNIDAINANAVR